MACHSCRVNVKEKYELFPEITEDEADVLHDLGPKLYKYGSTRMSCQIEINENMENCLIEIPSSAFALFDKFN